MHHRITAAAVATTMFAAGLAGASGASAQITAKTVVDRAQIEDLLTRYYNSLGHSSADSYANFYADDAEFVLGPNTYKGKAGIEGVYKGMAANPGPQRKAFAFNILLSNPLIVVKGDTATARVVFTETIIDNKGDAPRILTQGREFDHFVKVKGEWRFKRRQIMGPEGVPADWKD